MKVFVVDLSICNGCHNCQIACKDEHVGNDWSPYAKPQPDTGQFWMKVHEYTRGSVPKVKLSYIPTPCMHCKDAPCIPSCSQEAIYRRKDGMVVIDPDKCKGMRNCVDACPYGVIYFNEDLNLAQKCTGCAHLLDQGWEVPRCVDACPTGALRFGEEKEFKSLIAQAEVLHPESKTAPRVYYLNMPKRFIAGTVYDPEEEEVVIGATLTLTNEATNKTFKIQTDNFGDFWFDKLDVGRYTLQIETEKYLSKTIAHIDTEKDVNLGDIALYRIPESVVTA